MAGLSVNTVTVSGLTLLARATAASQLIYTRVLGSAVALVQAEAELADLSDFTDAEGGILSASAEGNRAIVRGVLRNQAETVTLRSFALCAKIAGDATDVVLAVQSDPDASVTIPGAGLPDAAVEVSWLLAIDNAGSVTVESVGPGTVSFADLARFVSTHKAGDPTSGDDQTILGQKRFSNDTIVEGKFYALGWANLDNGVTVNGATDLNDGATVGGNIVPDSPDSHSLGDPDKYFNHAYAMTVQCGECDARDVILTGELSGGENATIGSPGTYFPKAYVNAIHAGEIGEGVLPHPTVSAGVLSVPIGAIVLILLPVGSISTLDYAGLQFTVPTDAATVYTAIFNSGTGKAVSGSHTLPAGTYIGIGGGAETSGGDGWALVMRIA